MIAEYSIEQFSEAFYSYKGVLMSWQEIHNFIQEYKNYEDPVIIIWINERLGGRVELRNGKDQIVFYINRDLEEFTFYIFDYFKRNPDGDTLMFTREGS